MQIQNLGAAQNRGRWENSRTLGHYVQQGLAALAYARLGSQARERVEFLASLFASIFKRL